MIAFGKEHISYQKRMLELDRFNKTQITIYNSSTEEQWAKLFGANQGSSNKSENSRFSTDSYPQAILFNPLNGLIYVVNQLAATLQLFDQNDKLVERIALDESSIPTASPLAIELNPLNGEVYILGALSDKLYVVNSNLELQQTIALPIRPYSLRFNTINQKLYIQHLIGTTISVLAANDEFSIETIETGSIQTGVAINTTNSSWAVSDGNGTIKTYNSSNVLLQTFEFEGQHLEQAIYSQNGEQLLLLDKDQKKLFSIQSTNGSIIHTTSFENTPTKIVLGAEGDYYVSLITPDKIVQLNELLETTATFETGIAPYVWSINQSQEAFFISDPINSTITVVDPSGEQKAVSYSDDYDEVVTDFQYQPVLVKHLKVNYSGLNNLPFIRIGRRSSAGKKESRLISLHKYHSPQHFSQVYQVSEVDSEIIDGRAFWEVLIPPEQSVSLLIYHE